tara:strand:- start:2256 stop:8372 length:6117 start_codon:yes stop_codon:yes gene_type:complete
MAKKNQASSNKAVSLTQGFTSGMISDPDPRYQIKGSYRDALNIRLINDDGSSFTVENILGNKKFFNLNEICQQTEDGAAGDNTGILGTRVVGKAGETSGTAEPFSEIYIDPTSLHDDGTLVGDYYPNPSNTYTFGFTITSGVIPFYGNNIAYSTGGQSPAPTWPVNFASASIVGHYSYNSNVIFIIVIPDENDQSGGFSESGDPNRKTRTIFLDVVFDKDLNVISVTDLHVCYDFNRSDRGYPHLNMKMDMPVRVEGIIENECISRIFWTDNINPLRSINIKQQGKNQLSPDVLDLTPMHNPSQPVATKAILGSLPVGQIQYCYKYLSSNGGETVMSPWSTLYHTSKHDITNTQSFYGSPSGDPLIDVSSQGFEITITDLDPDFDIIELYAIHHESNDGPVRVSLAGNRHYNGNAGSVVFNHTHWAGDLENGVDMILIDINTWDVCKDLAIKDNILFAGNLKTRDNVISEKEWNVKVRRYNIADADSGGGSNTGTITSDDTQIKEYEIDSGGDLNALTSPGLTWESGMPKWRTYKGDDVTTINGVDYKDEGRIDIVKKQSHEYRYLSDGMTLGGESYDYDGNQLGGCRVTFDLRHREVDVQHNVDDTPFISAGGLTDIPTDNISDNGGNFPDTTITNNSSTVYTATANLGGSKDPCINGFKGYRRGEMYRFGVQIYDKNGRPGNVLWVGDIEMPEMHDPLRRIMIDHPDYWPGIPTKGNSGDSLIGRSLFATTGGDGAPAVQDHRTSFIFGCTTPSTDVAWFNQSIGPYTVKETHRYIDPNNIEFTHKADITGTNSSGTGPTIETISATTTTTTGAGIDILKAYRDHLGQYTPYYTTRYISPANMNAAGDNTNDNTPKMRPQTNMIMQEHDDVHYALDLFVNFEFRIPENVRNKISGFRVVRAERLESDKSILQQGILNQTVAYGHKDVYKGYNQDKIFGHAPSHVWGDDNYTFGHGTFANENTGNDQEDRTATVHVKYDDFLNGYIGLAENSNLAFWTTNNTSSSFDLLEDGAWVKANVWSFEEWEGASTGAAGQFKNWQSGLSYGSDRTPSTHDAQYKHSAYFGCYELLPNVIDQYDKSNRIAVSNTSNWIHKMRGAAYDAVQGSIFTLDCPDSAFGTSSYNFKTGDKIRVDAIMKLVDEDRTTKALEGSSSPTGHDASPWGMLSHSGSNNPNGPTHAIDSAEVGGGSYEWTSNNKNLNKETALKYCKFIQKGREEDGYGALIAKYYIYDTYWGIGMSVDGGKIYAPGAIDELVIEGDNVKYRPSQHHDIYHNRILTAREITPGDIVGKSFFKEGVRIIDEDDGDGNSMAGFSNNTLGFVERRRKHVNQSNHDWLFAGIGGSYQSGGTSWLFGALTNKFSRGKQWSSSQLPNKKDVTYDTCSSIQMGLRSILIQIDGDGEFGEKRGLLNPRNLSEILEHRHWGPDAQGGANNDYYYLNQGLNSSNRIFQSDSNVTDNQFGGPSYIPFKFLCSIVRNTIPYGGSSLPSIQNTRYIPAGNFHPIKKDADGSSKESHLSKVFGGDTFITFYTHQKTAAVYETRSHARWQIFPVESDTNTDMRMGYHLSAGDVNIGDVKFEDGGGNWNDWEYNSVYSQDNNVKSSLMIDETKTCRFLNLPYEVAYSNTKIAGEPTDSFKIFQFRNFHDVESQYGEITRLKTWRNDLYVLQEKSLAKLLVNPISMIQDELGTSIYVGTGDVIENHQYISSIYGTRHMDSVVASERALYFIDNTYGKLIQFNGSELKILSDELGQRNAFNDAIKGYGNLGSKQKYIDSRNYVADNSMRFNGIASIFDYKNNELLITFHSSNLDENHERIVVSDVPETKSKTIVYSESINAFTSYYSVVPTKWMNIGGYVVSTQHQTYFNEDDANYWNGYFYGNGLDENTYSQDYLSLWKWDEQVNNYKTVFFNEDIGAYTETHESSITKIINEVPAMPKVFDNAKIIMDTNITTLTTQTPVWVEFETDFTAIDGMNITGTTFAKYREGLLRFPLRTPSGQGNFSLSNKPRQRGTYLKLTYRAKNPNKFNIFAILAQYRKSYQ